MNINDNIAAQYQEYLFPMTGFLDYLQILRIPKKNFIESQLKHLLYGCIQMWKIMTWVIAPCLLMIY